MSFQTGAVGNAESEIRRLASAHVRKVVTLLYEALPTATGNRQRIDRSSAVAVMLATDSHLLADILVEPVRGREPHVGGDSTLTRSRDFPT